MLDLLFFTFASVKAFQTYFCVKLQCILDLFYHLLKECEYSLILYDLFCLVCMHVVRSCLPSLRIPKAVGHFGIRGHWVKASFNLSFGSPLNAGQLASLVLFPFKCRPTCIFGFVPFKCRPTCIFGFVPLYIVSSYWKIQNAGSQNQLRQTVSLESGVSSVRN